MNNRSIIRRKVLIYSVLILLLHVVTPSAFILASEELGEDSGVSEVVQETALESVEEVVELSEDSEDVEIVSEGVEDIEESSPVDESTTSDDSVEESVDESVDETEQPSEESVESDEDSKETSEPAILKLLTDLDDNTLIIEGYATADTLIELVNQQDVILAHAYTDTDGGYELSLDQTLDAGEEVKLVMTFDEEVLSELRLTVKGRGISLDEPVTEESETIKGKSSPNRPVQLLDASAKLLATVHSDLRGHFEFSQPATFEAGDHFTLQVLDREFVARQLEVVVEEVAIIDEDSDEESDEETKQYDLITVPPFAIVDRNIRVDERAIVLDSSVITTETKEIKGRVIIHESYMVGDNVRDIVNQLRSELKGEDISLTITSGNTIIGRKTARLSNNSNLSFSFDISDLNLSPGNISLKVEIPPQSFTWLFFAEYFVTFEPATRIVKVEPLVNHFQFKSVPDSFNFGYDNDIASEEVVLPRVDENPLTIEVLDTYTYYRPATPEWHLTVHATQPMTLHSANGSHSIAGSLYFNGLMIEGSNQAQTVAYRSNFTDHGFGNYSYTIPSSQDFYLKLTPYTDVIPGTYETTIQWNLVNAPQ